MPAQSSAAAKANGARIVWLRLGDLRLRDNPALCAAAGSALKGDKKSFYGTPSSSSTAPVVPVFTWFPAEEQEFMRSLGMKRDWSYEGTTLQALLAGEKGALSNLDKALHEYYGNRLRILCEGVRGGKSAVKAVLSLAQEVGACEVHFNRRAEPAERWREGELEKLGTAQGVTSYGHSAFLFKEPENCPIFRAVGQGLHIFKAFWDGWHKGGNVRQALEWPERCPALPGTSTEKPFAGTARASWPFGDRVPTSRVSGRPLSQDVLDLQQHWELTEEGAEKTLAQFQGAGGGLSRYKGSITRDAGPKAKESRLSPYFRLGILSMVDLYWRTDRSSDQARKWFRRCAWRDYSYWMLFHWKDLPEEPMRSAFRGLAWELDKEALVEAWRQGRTGYPLVDAAMRELRETGYLQQNMRHTVGQFLVEALDVDWREGEEWFHVALADSDLAINSMMWQHQGLMGVSQWLLGVEGHPVRHARQADPAGHYVKQWVPELAKLPREYLHAPWEASPAALKKAGVTFGRGAGEYPERILEDVDASRQRFHDRLRQCRADAPDSCFAPDGADYITVPPSSGLSSPGIRALTERTLREAPTGRPSGKGKAAGKGKQRESRAHDDDGWKAGAKSKGSGKGEGAGGKRSWQRRAQSERNSDAMAIDSEEERQPRRSSTRKVLWTPVDEAPSQQPVRRWRVRSGVDDTAMGA
eukprot:TRINITY_DN13643_c0_g1_i1.p1 TRINITY_DN13643_c0_g1~~TRINITY_DN13643_c0_g1_i1.p1  ORF type:complete len:697 (-),score=136.23 TRINITY_DN13643_c0_g1_i1:254-2344(-)